MHVAVHSDLTADELVKRLPEQYRQQPLPSLPGEARFILIVVGTGEEVLRSVSLSRALTKARVDLTTLGGTLVVCGYDFTQEAREMLLRVGAVVCGKRDYGWTDARYAQVHERLSNREK